MSTYREALDQILIICNGSETYTRRVQQIHEVAMKALGMTENQRTARHEAIFARVGNDPGLTNFRAREARRAARLEAQCGAGVPP